MLADSHTHSVYSFDGHAAIAEMCAAAVERGITSLAVTDHHDIDGVLDGFFPDYDGTAARREFETAARRYAGQVELVRGIELGQPNLRPDEARAFLQRHAFDFVIGSCHNLPNVPDFYFIHFTEMPEPLMADLFRRSLRQLTDIAGFSGIHTIAHPLYPTRYMARGGRGVRLSDFEEDFRSLFHVMREMGLAMEVNLKGIRAGEQKWEQEEYVLRLWHDCGGRRVTCGTDAHRAREIGVGIGETYGRLRAVGFASVCVPGAGGLRECPLL